MPKKGFTLVELLVVISIIAILSVVGIVVFTGIQKSARDVVRKSDIEAIAKAYEAKYNGTYQALTNNDFASGSRPKDPNSSKGEYFNWLDSNGSGFKVCASLEANPNFDCRTPAVNCYCQFSSQGSVLPGSSPNPSGSFHYSGGLGGSSSAPSCDPNGTLSWGLVGYWKMDEGTGTTVVDSSGHGGTLQFNSSRPASWGGDSSGKEGNALKMYEGPNRSYSGASANSSSLNISGTQLSFGGWVYLTAMPQSGSYGTVLQSAGGSIYRLLIYPDGTSLVHINSKQIPEWGQGSQIGINGWHFIFVTYDGENIKFYKDNNPPRTDPYNQPVGASGLGMGYGEYPAIFGYVDEVRVYNRALSEQEVTALAGGCISP